ncbi:unnamed protein product [Soboliphyme baturini]|uniref:Phosphoinositide phospholipase C n=1 Tax=Soboliphyme baturini TaxID=241478 RepID=A0A183IM80_9BILA|nr:unnamed protein product [Soboliphyme baturini]
MAVCSVKDGNLEEAIKLVKSGCEAHRLKKNRTLLPIRVTLSPDTFNLHIQGEVQQCAFAMLRDGTKSISMRQALEIRSGWNTDNFRRATQDLNFVTDVRETDCLSIILRHPIRHYKTIDLVFNTTDVQLAWMAVLNHVIDKMKEESSHLRITWLRRKFYEGDVNKNGFLNFKEVWKLVFSLNLELKESVAMDIFQCLDFEEFVHFFRFLTDRPDLKRVLRRYWHSTPSLGKREMTVVRLFRFSAKHCEYFTVNDLQRFLQTEQGFADITLKECQELIKKYECEDSFAKASLMSRYGLRKLLYTKYGTIFNPELKKIYMNMTLPLPNYFICSTHNTYLCGHQLVGDATIEGYIMALKKGARLLESEVSVFCAHLVLFNSNCAVSVDMYDGAEAPVVTHGRTLVKPVLLQDVLHSIRTFGFSISPYPLILSLENHCSQDQQDVVVNIFEEILGDKIYRWKQQSTFPSPEQLKEKILIKVDPVNCMISKTEDEFQQLAECDAEDLIRFTSKYLMKGYPRGTRTASTNFNPVPQWLCGIQAGRNRIQYYGTSSRFSLLGLVCLNVQTADEATDLNAAMFELNGRTGFVLKPEFMLKREKKAAKRLQPLTLNVEVIAGFFLPKPSTAESYAEVIDPYVSVELFGTIEDCIKFKTGVIWNNGRYGVLRIFTPQGFNPMWNETFNIYVREPELAFLRFCVKDFNRKAQNDFIGQYTLPVVAIRDGYSHVRLETGFQHATDPTATLFVRIKRSPNRLLFDQPMLPVDDIHGVLSETLTIYVKNCRTRDTGKTVQHCLRRWSRRPTFLTTTDLKVKRNCQHPAEEVFTFNR